MRKKYFYILTALFIAACTYTVVAPDDDAELSASELVSTQSINADSNVGTYSFDITSNNAWTISTNQSWCTISPASGTGNMTITVNLAQNTSAQSRTATITVRVSNVAVTITVTQSGITETANLTVSPTSYNFTAEGGTSSAFTVTSNQSWTISSSASWLTTSKTNGGNNSGIGTYAPLPTNENNNEFTATATVNTATEPRFATISVSGGVITRTISVSQYGQQDAPTITGMVFVKGGTFTMGCTGEQVSDCYSDESPAHSVTLNSFYIGKYEVTQKEWFDVMGSWPVNTIFNNLARFGTGDNYPVYYVGWYDIIGHSGSTQVINGVTYWSDGFIYKLNQKTGKQYRLPTEAEWEYAARGGASSKGYKYSGSNNIDAVAWYSNNSDSESHLVGGKQANELGIYDMSGNVSELCADRYGPYSSNAQYNPTGSSTGSHRVNRGGNWSSSDTRVSRRYYYIQDYYSTSLYIGFRLACSP